MKLVFLWHMHQPVYKNGLTGEYELPWVFLHAIKDYYDMPWHLSKFPQIKAVFNLTPSLIAQIEEYASGRARCRFLTLMSKPVKELSLEEKSYLVKIFFSGSPKLFSPFSFLKELSVRFQRNKKRDFCKNLTNQDFLNLQVLFLLSWCGNYLKSENETVRKLIDKGSAFSEDEKLRLIEELLKFTGRIVPIYRNLSKIGQVELTTSPFYHPILPLLLNMEVAKVSTPEVKLPALHVSFRDDAEVQIERALSFHRQRFGNLKGIWCSEGAVSEDVLELLSHKGIGWTATDEEILFRSLEERWGTREPLYKVYSFKGVKLFFRDRELSDLIGFVYKGWDPSQASEDFVKRLKNISDSYSSSVVSVVLDGENCWEFYDNNGYEFRESLYSAISDSTWIETVLPSELEPERELSRLFPGSWIGGNFLTWIGDNEKNRAWELLGTTKLELERRNGDVAVKEHLLIAEGSDWFWWFGKGHYSPFSHDFDRLFRSHLIAVYRELGVDIPHELLSPIKKFTGEKSKPPKGYVKPIIDGEVTNYYEWLLAGEIDLLEFSTMETTSFVMEKLYYGYDEEGNLYLRIDGNWEKFLNRNFELIVELEGKELQKFSFKFSDNRGTTPECKGTEAALKKVLEIAIPYSCFEKAERLKLAVKLFLNRKFVEEAPHFTYGVLELSKDFETDWIV